MSEFLRNRPQFVGLAGILLLAGVLPVACAGERESASPDTPGDLTRVDAVSSAQPAVNDDWWSPAPDSTWQWQLQGSVDTAYDVDLYDIDLFDSDGELIASLHEQDRHVVCYFSAGSAEDWRSDFARFTNDVLGNPLADWEGERWIDIRSPLVHTVMLARLDLARERGCDGVEPDNVQGYEEDTGFALSYEDQVAYNRMIALAAHDRGLAVGLKNGGAQVADVLDVYDFALSEECHAYDECGAFAAFIAAGKPVFVAEYAPSEATALELADRICASANDARLRTLILPLELDDSFRVACVN